MTPTSRRPRAVAGACSLVLLAAGVGLAPAARAANCSQTSVGLVPLGDLGAGTYQGFSGGLYPGGANDRPAGHLAAGVAIAAGVQPLDPSGAPDPAGGRIVLLTIGMSNTSRESNALVSLAAASPLRNPRVVVVNGAQAGQSASVIDDPAAAFWTVIDDRLAALGLSALQVQAIWFKEANPASGPPFPAYAESLRVQFTRIMHIVATRYPNAQLCYSASRIYGGYASTALNPEPWAYETGFAVKWFLEDQLNGSAALNYDPAAGPVNSPWLSWGPYLWADGLVPRSDGLMWLCSDMDSDGTHPSEQGSNKVAGMLLDFFLDDPTTAPWFRAATSDAAPMLPPRPTIAVGPAWPNPSNPNVTLPIELVRRATVRVEVVSPAGRVVRTLVEGALDPGRYDVPWDGTDAGGRPVASGAYLFRVRDGGAVHAVKITLVR